MVDIADTKPWKVAEKRATDIVIRNSDNDPIALVYIGGWDRTSYIHHAALIARAWEIPRLEAEIKQWQKSFNDILELLRETGDKGRYQKAYEKLLKGTKHAQKTQEISQ